MFSWHVSFLVSVWFLLKKKNKMQTPLNFIGFFLKVSYGMLGFPLQIAKDKSSVVFKWYDHFRCLQYIFIVGLVSFNFSIPFIGKFTIPTFLKLLYIYEKIPLFF